MSIPSIGQLYRRYRTLQTHRISSLPVVILMPHSACNCRCLMCDIWKDNANVKVLLPETVAPLLEALEAWHTHTVVFSGGEALLSRHLFTLCEMLKEKGIRISLLSTGLLLEKYADQIVQWMDEVVVSLDGDAATHDSIRNVPGAFAKLAKGIAAIRALAPGFRITARSVIHRGNFMQWIPLIEAAREIGIDQVSFLPADVSSHAFNREQAWDMERQQEVLPDRAQLPALATIIATIRDRYHSELGKGFIAESAVKLQQIHTYYAACYGLSSFPFKRCNAPWVSTVIEADGEVRPCFFHPSMGNIYTQSLPDILNSAGAIAFRRNLDVQDNPTCKKCVCYLNLPVTG
jgi:Fe-coproporphyrin III synthase